MRSGFADATPSAKRLVIRSARINGEGYRAAQGRIPTDSRPQPKVETTGFHLRFTGQHGANARGLNNIALESTRHLSKTRTDPFTPPTSPRVNPSKRPRKTSNPISISFLDRSPYRSTFCSRACGQETSPSRRYPLCRRTLDLHRQRLK